MTEKILPPGGSYGLELCTGDAIRLFQTEGQQVADLVSFSRETEGEALSMYSSASHNGRWSLSTGDILVGNRGNELLRIDGDTVGENYIGGGFCNRFSNTRRFGTPGAKWCLDNLNSAGRAFGLKISESEGDMCFNVFMRVVYRPDGTKETLYPSAKPGDEVILRSLCRQVVLISNCPQTRGKTNAGRSKSLGIEELGETPTR